VASGADRLRTSVNRFELSRAFLGPPASSPASGLLCRERFEQELQLGGIVVVQLRISDESGVAVA
jgi:hypothetical protein